MNLIQEIIIQQIVYDTDSELLFEFLDLFLCLGLYPARSDAAFWTRRTLFFEFKCEHTFEGFINSFDYPFNYETETFR